MIGQDPAARPHLLMWLSSSVSYVLYVLLLFLQVAIGDADLAAAMAVAIAAVIANAGFFVALRTGRSARFTRDRWLGHTQLGVGLGFMWAVYAVSGSNAAATLVICSTHLVYAMFSMTARQVTIFLAVSLSGLAATMAACAALDPDRYVPRAQVVGFAYTFLVLVLISRLAGKLAAMNDAVRANRRELMVALARVQELAVRDDLTSLHNRRHMQALMDGEVAEHTSTGEPLCLAVIDLDLFKHVNDTHGHQAGDEVLRRLAVVSKHALRDQDLMARWGGEEFMLMFPGTSRERALSGLQRLKDQFAETDFDDIAMGTRVTFSAGLVEVDPTSRLEDSIERADQAMYRAKTLGRDRIVVG